MQPSPRDGRRALEPRTAGPARLWACARSARDTLEIDIYFTGDGELFVDVRDFLDSDDNGRIDALDLEVERSGTDLVLDLDAVGERAGLSSLS